MAAQRRKANRPAMPCARRSAPDLRANDHLENDLALTSLDIVSITVELERVFGLTINDGAAAAKPCAPCGEKE